MPEVAERPPKLGTGVYTIAGLGDEHNGPCHIVRIGDERPLCGITLKPGRQLHSRQACPRSNGGPCARTCPECLELAGQA